MPSLPVALVRLFCRIPESFRLRRYNALCWHVTSLVEDSSESKMVIKKLLRPA